MKGIVYGIISILLLSNVMAYVAGETVEVKFNATKEEFCGYMTDSMPTRDRFIFTTMTIIAPNGSVVYAHEPKASYGILHQFNMNYTFAEEGTYTACMTVTGIEQKMDSCSTDWIDCYKVKCRNYTIEQQCQPPTYFRQQLNDQYYFFNENWQLYDIQWQS